MKARHLVVHEQALRAASLRDPDGALLGVLDHHPLEDGSDAVSDSAVQALVAEARDGPALERLHDIRVCCHCQDGCLLRTERQDGRTSRGVGRGADLPSEGVHGPNGGIALHERQRETAKRDGANGDSPDDVHEVCMEVRGFLQRPKECRAREADVRERRQGVGERVRAPAIR